MTGPGWEDTIRMIAQATSEPEEDHSCVRCGSSTVIEFPAELSPLCDICAQEVSSTLAVAVGEAMKVMTNDQKRIVGCALRDGKPCDDCDPSFTCFAVPVECRKYPR